MAVRGDLSGRFIRFEVSEGATGTDGPYFEYEIINGSVQDTLASQQSYLPLNDTITSHVGYGRTITYTFQGVLLVSELPWTRLETNTRLIDLTVTMNRGGTSTNMAFYDESYHYSQHALVVSMTHTFDTMTHQVFDVVIVANGTYTAPFPNELES